MPDFTRIFAESGLKNTIGDTEYDGGWDDIVGSNPPSYKDFNSIMNEQDNKLSDLNARLTPLSGKNKVINGNFAINQRAVSGTVVLVAGEYGHDRFRGGSAGCTYTFTTSNNVTTITINAGTLEQEVEGMNLFSGNYILSWSGTAQGQINGDGFGSSGVGTILTGGTNAVVEFNAGTLSLVQLEASNYATDFEHRPIGEELSLCYRYGFKRADAGSIVVGSRKVNSATSGAVTSASMSVTTKIPIMRVTPTITGVTAGSITLNNESGGVVTTMTSLPTVLRNEELLFSCNFSSADVADVTQMRFTSGSPFFDAEL